MAGERQGFRGLAAAIALVFGVVPRRRRRQGMLVIALMLVASVAELMTLGAIFPFLALIAGPAGGAGHPWLQAVPGLAGAGQAPNWGRSIALAAGLFALAATLAAAVRIALVWATQRYVTRLGLDIGVALFARVLHQPYGFHLATNSAAIVASVNRVQAVLEQTFLPALQGLAALTIALAILAGLLAISPVAAICSAAAFGSLYALVFLATRRRLAASGATIARTFHLRTQTVQEALGGIRDVIVDQAQPVHLARFARVEGALRDAQATYMLIGAVPRFVMEGLGLAMIAGLAILLQRQPGGLVAALPILGALALGAQRLLPLMHAIYQSWTSLTASRATLEEVLALLRLPPPPAGHAAGPVLAFAETIRLEDVGYRYAGARDAVLAGIDLTIRRGERIGFVGPTGGGKSTLVDLVMGLLPPGTGTIRIDGVALDPSSVPRWQRAIAHVPQHIFLADASLTANIALAGEDGGIDMARVRAAARAACIDDFVRALPHGYDTMIGERGVRLSGGQRQRIGIARALYRRAVVLILDEATSALDDATEARVMDAIRALDGGITILMVAHRLSTLAGCDRLYHVADGRIVPATARPGRDLAHRPR